MPVSDKAQCPIERIFAFGFWAGGFGPKPYTLGFEQFLHEMRRMCMNCLVHAPELGKGRIGLNRFKRHLSLCRDYGIYAVPSGGQDCKHLKDLGNRFRQESRILGWYIRDEPEPGFLPQFLACRNTLADIAPDQPALCLFYRPDSVAEFALHQRVLLTDCYPFGYMHDGVSLGPHFGIKEGPLALDRGLGQFNPWGRRGILEWMDLCRALAGEVPHWITLQTFESGDGRLVRWREPTAPEMRLQTWLAIAGGAKGITYFHYALNADDYGNRRPSRHGEFTPLLDEIGRLGAEITPLGSLLLDAEVAEPLTVLPKLRPTPDSGERIEVRRLRSAKLGADYLVVFNNDVQTSSTAQLNLGTRFLAGRNVYDLTDLRRVETEDLPGAVIFEVSLPPGGGRMFGLADPERGEFMEHAILKGRCLNEAMLLTIDYELAERSGVNVKPVRPIRTDEIERLEAGDYAVALSLVRQRNRALHAAMRTSTTFSSVQRTLDNVRHVLGQLPSDSHPLQRRLSEAYVGLLGLFWEGRAASIRKAASDLRALVEEVEGAVQEGRTASPGEDALRRIERVAGRYERKE